MRTVVAVLAVAFLALAGCSSKSTPDTYTCMKTGKVIDLANVDGSSAKGFDPESACPAPLPPSVAFAPLPGNLTAYFPAIIAWNVSPGNYTEGHSMLTQIRMSHHPIAVADLKKPDDYGTMLVQYAHQEVPAKFDGKVKFILPGAYYLRAYAQVRGNGIADADYWSSEVKLMVSEVNATGKVVAFTRDSGPAAGGQTGKFSPSSAQLVLGDAIQIINKDVTEHTFTFSGTCKVEPVKLGAPAPGGSVLSAKFVMTIPGTCSVKTDDPAGAQTATGNIAEPI